MKDNFINQNLPEEKAIHVSLTIMGDELVLVDVSEDKTKDIAYRNIDNFLVKGEVGYGTLVQWIIEILTDYEEGLFGSTKKQRMMNSYSFDHSLKGILYPPLEVYLERRRKLTLTPKILEADKFKIYLSRIFDRLYFVTSGKKEDGKGMGRLFSMLYYGKSHFRATTTHENYTVSYKPKVFCEGDVEKNTLSFEFQYLKLVPFNELTKEESSEYHSELIRAKNRDYKVKNLFEEVSDMYEIE